MVKQLAARQSNEEGLKIVYDDVAPYAKENSNPQTIKTGPPLHPRLRLYPHKGLYPGRTVERKEFPELRRDDLTYPGYALCYPRFSLMNGDYINLPDPHLDYGYISEEYTDENGNFGYTLKRQGLRPHSGLYPRVFLFPHGSSETEMGNPRLTITFNQRFTSVGLLLTFNTLSRDYASDLNIKWYQGDEILSDKDFQPDSERYFCNNYVQLYDRIEITFRATSKPYRPVFLTRIDYGIYRDFFDDELLTTNCLQEINTISEQISINTLNFTVRTESSIPFDLQKKQRLGLYFNGELLGNFYLKNGARKNRVDYHMESHDAIGVLDTNEFSGGVYTGETVASVIEKIFDGESFGYTLDESLQEINLHGYIPYTTKRNALMQIAFAIGAVVDTSNNEGVVIYPQETEVSGYFDETDTFEGLTLEHRDTVTGIRLTVHQYQKIDESQELYNDTLDGTAEIIFSEPYHSLSVTGGTISRSGDNFAIVTGTGGTVVLTGKRYNHMTTSLLKENPDVVFNKSIKEVTDATLIHSGNAQEALDRVYNYYQQPENVVGEVLLGDKVLGQVVEADTGYDGKRKGTLESINYQFSRKIIRAEVTIHE